jgi:hypothetical protein
MNRSGGKEKQKCLEEGTNVVGGGRERWWARWGRGWGWGMLEVSYTLVWKWPCRSQSSRITRINRSAPLTAAILSHTPTELMVWNSQVSHPVTNRFIHLQTLWVTTDARNRLLFWVWLLQLAQGEGHWARHIRQCLMMYWLYEPMTQIHVSCCFFVVKNLKQYHGPSRHHIFRSLPCLLFQEAKETSVDDSLML